MLGLAHRPTKPLSNFMFSGRISLTIICKNQSVSINFEIAAVKKWPTCAVPFVSFWMLEGWWGQCCHNHLLSTRGQNRQVKESRHEGVTVLSLHFLFWKICHYMQSFNHRDSYSSTCKRQITNLTADFFHSGLFSFHHITSHRSHYQHHTWSSIFSSASHRLDIHTNTPWVHHSSESASPNVRGTADEDQRPSPHTGEILPSSEDPRLTSRFPQNALSSVCVCVRLQYAFLHLKENKLHQPWVISYWKGKSNT